MTLKLISNAEILLVAGRGNMVAGRGKNSCRTRNDIFFTDIFYSELHGSDMLDFIQQANEAMLGDLDD